MTNYKKVDKEKIKRRIKEARIKDKEFWDEIDTSVIEDIFKYGLEAEIFIDDRTKKVLGPRDNLKKKFNKGVYTYLLMRIIKPRPPPKPTNEQIMQHALKNYPPQAKPEHGKIGGYSKYLPAYAKPATSERNEELLEMCRGIYKGVPDEPTITEEE